MSNRRKRAVGQTPLEEDLGIFKTPVIDVALDLSPFVRKSSRGDAIYIGVISDKEVEVVFPGRRTQDLGRLRSALADRQNQTHGPANLPILAKGVWRSRNMEEDGLVTERVYQFMVSEWHLPDGKGGGTSFGEPPLKE